MLDAGEFPFVLGGDCSILLGTTLAFRRRGRYGLLFIDGHTDADPIARTKDQWEDNWDLAATRANAVRKYLTSKGVDTRQVDLRAFGPNKPKGNKAASRRVEIVVQVD